MSASSEETRAKSPDGSDGAPALPSPPRYCARCTQLHCQCRPASPSLYSYTDELDYSEEEMDYSEEEPPEEASQAASDDSNDFSYYSYSHRSQSKGDGENAFRYGSEEVHVCKTTGFVDTQDSRDICCYCGLGVGFSESHTCWAWIALHPKWVNRALCTKQWQQQVGVMEAAPCAADAAETPQLEQNPLFRSSTLASTRGLEEVPQVEQRVVGFEEDPEIADMIAELESQLVDGEPPRKQRKLDMDALEKKVLDMIKSEISNPTPGVNAPARDQCRLCLKFCQGLRTQFNTLPYNSRRLIYNYSQSLLRCG